MSHAIVSHALTARQKPGTGEISLLLFEDNPADSFYFREIASEVERSRLVVEHVSSLNAGLSIIHSKKFDIILLDLNLTDSWGLDTFNRVFAVAGRTPIIVLSGMDDTELALSAVSHGAQDYIAKNQIATSLLERAVFYALERGRLLHLELELRDARREKETANRVKRHFLSNVSHELRTPLTATIGYLQLLFSTPHLPEKAKEYAKTALDHSYELEVIVGEVLEMSKIESNDLALEVDSADSRTLCESVLGQHQAKASQKGLTVDLLMDYAGQITTDTQKLKYILSELVDNAVKFTLRGSVSVRVSATQHHIEFTVTDTGPGMSPEKTNELFTPFHSDLNYQSMASRSAGLGLAISHAYAQLLGASIAVTSEPGDGSTFVVSVSRPSHSQDSEQYETELLREGLKTFNEETRLSLVQLLKRADAIAITTLLDQQLIEDPFRQELLRALSVFDYELILDLMLPHPVEQAAREPEHSSRPGAQHG